MSYKPQMIQIQPFDNITYLVKPVYGMYEFLFIDEIKKAIKHTKGNPSKQSYRLERRDMFAI